MIIFVGFILNSHKEKKKLGGFGLILMKFFVVISLLSRICVHNVPLKSGLNSLIGLRTTYPLRTNPLIPLRSHSLKYAKKFAWNNFKLG